jgi:hypothetical protein
MNRMVSRDPYLILADVKAHLADHQPLTNGDAEAWRICDCCQRIVSDEERRERISSWRVQ